MPAGSSVVCWTLNWRDGSYQVVNYAHRVFVNSFCCSPVVLPSSRTEVTLRHESTEYDGAVFRRCSRAVHAIETVAGARTAAERSITEPILYFARKRNWSTSSGTPLFAIDREARLASESIMCWMDNISMVEYSPTFQNLRDRRRAYCYYYHPRH